MARGVRDEHDATVIARASAHELCHILTRYARYPRIVRFARLVTPDGGWYSHWEARVLGHNGYNKWEAVNEGCRIRVVIRYQPRGGLFADLAGELVLGQRFGRRLRADPRDDLRQFATMIEQAPEGGWTRSPRAICFPPAAWRRASGARRPWAGTSEWSNLAWLTS